MQHRTVITILLLAGLLSALRCSLVEPEPETGVLTIQIEEQQPDETAAGKASESLARLHCRLYRGETAVHNEYYIRQGDYFQIIIKKLIPSENYRVILWGFDENKVLSVQGKAANITISPDKVTHVRLSWVPFRLALTSPQNAQFISSGQPVFDWNSIDGVNMYEIQIDSTISFGSPVCITARTDNSYYQPSEPLPDDTYYWHVRCRDCDGDWSDFSNSYNVKVRSAGPPPPLLISPADGAISNQTSSISFDWSDVPEAHDYKLEVSRTESFIETYYSMAGFLKSEAFLYGTFAGFEDGEYFWHVASRDSLGDRGAWSEPFKLIFESN